jgi:hypothetical protein
MLLKQLHFSVNLGGWLVCEPFITPALYEPYFNAGISVPDEWGLSLAMDNDKANGGLATLMENHYKTFIVGVLSLHVGVRNANFFDSIDGGRFCSNCSSRPQLGSYPVRILGDRSAEQ